MQLNMQTEASNNGGSEELNSSDDDQIAVLFRRMMKEMEVMVTRTVEQMEILVRKVEEIQSAQDKFITCWNKNSGDEIGPSRERSLELRFLDEVSVTVFTGTEIKTKEGTSIRIALVDNTTGRIVESGAEASAKVEILLLEADPKSNVLTWSHEEFDSRVIKESENKKPRLAKNTSVYLDKGNAFLDDIKLGQNSIWKKGCSCVLGARVVNNFDGCNVKEALTEPFLVKDKRTKLYEKHYPPSLTDNVRRLENVGRVAARQLNDAKVDTVQDFLFLLSVDPQKLQNILGVGAKVWKATVDHAQTCNIDDEKTICLYNSPSSELNISVVFNVVGQLNGVIRDNYYFPVEYLSDADKAGASELLVSAFENRKDMIQFDNEASFLETYPNRSLGTNATNESIEDDLERSNLIAPSLSRTDPANPIRSRGTDAADGSTEDGPEGSNFMFHESTNTTNPTNLSPPFQPDNTEPGTGSYIPSFSRCNSLSPSRLLGPEHMDYLLDSPHGLSILSPSCCCDISHLLHVHFVDNEHPYPLCPDHNFAMETQMFESLESCSGVVHLVGGLAVSSPRARMRWRMVVRQAVTSSKNARMKWRMVVQMLILNKKRFKGFGDDHVTKKKQRYW